ARSRRPAPSWNVWSSRWSATGKPRCGCRRYRRAGSDRQSDLSDRRPHHPPGFPPGVSTGPVPGAAVTPADYSTPTARPPRITSPAVSAGSPRLDRHQDVDPTRRARELTIRLATPPPLGHGTYLVLGRKLA